MKNNNELIEVFKNIMPEKNITFIIKTNHELAKIYLNSYFFKVSK